MGGVGEGEIGTVDRLRIAAESHPSRAAFRRIGDERHAELRVPVGEAAHVANFSLWCRFRERTVALNAECSLPNHQAAQTAMLLVAFSAPRPLQIPVCGCEISDGCRLDMTADRGMTRQTGGILDPRE